MLDQMFSELTLLGFIGILLFFAEQSVAIADYSERVFGDPDTIAACAEEVHMTLFLVMLVYLGMVVCLVVVGKALRRWSAWEAGDVPDVPHLANKLADDVVARLPLAARAGAPPARVRRAARARAARARVRVLRDPPALRRAAEGRGRAPPLVQLLGVPVLAHGGDALRVCRDPVDELVRAARAPRRARARVQAAHVARTAARAARGRVRDAVRAVRADPQARARRGAAWTPSSSRTACCSSATSSPSSSGAPPRPTPMPAAADARRRRRRRRPARAAAAGRRARRAAAARRRAATAAPAAPEPSGVAAAPKPSAPRPRRPRGAGAPAAARVVMGEELAALCGGGDARAARRDGRRPARGAARCFTPEDARAAAGRRRAPRRSGRR